MTAIEIQKSDFAMLLHAHLRGQNTSYEINVDKGGISTKQAVYRRKYGAAS
jgi:hypothetical protein